MWSCLATQGKDLNKSTKKNDLIPKTAWTALEVVAGSSLSVVWLMLQNFAHKALWHPQLSPISWKKSLLQTHIWLQKRVFPGLALAVGGGGANRTTENCSLVAYVPPHLGALTAASPAPLGRGLPQACVCCHPRVPAPLIPGQEETLGLVFAGLLAVPSAGWHGSLCTAVAIGTCTQCWNEMSPRKACNVCATRAKVEPISCKMALIHR